MVLPSLLHPPFLLFPHTIWFPSPGSCSGSSRIGETHGIRELFDAAEAQQKMDSWVEAEISGILEINCIPHIPEASEKHQDVQVTSKDALRNFKNFVKIYHSFSKFLKNSCCIKVISNPDWAALLFFFFFSKNQRINNLQLFAVWAVYCQRGGWRFPGRATFGSSSGFLSSQGLHLSHSSGAPHPHRKEFFFPINRD